MIGAPNVSEISSGVNAIAHPSSALSSTGISITMPRTREGASDATSSVVFAPERRAADHGLVDLEVIEQRHDLAAEDRDRVAPHVAWLVGLAVPEQVERDDPVAAVREVPRERVVHAAREQQPRQQHDGPPPLSVLVVCESLSRRGRRSA